MNLPWIAFSRAAIDEAGQRLPHLFAEVGQNINVRPERAQRQVCGTGDAQRHYTISGGGDQWGTESRPDAVKLGQRRRKWLKMWSIESAYCLVILFYIHEHRKTYRN